MTKITFLSIAIVALIFTDFGERQRSFGAEAEGLRARTDELVQPYLDNNVIVGMTIGVLHEGNQQVFGYGRMSREDARVPNGDTIYEIGGISKVLTGVLLADAVVQGHVRLDQPAGQLLPAGVKMPAMGSRPITLQDLSNHVSGLPRIPDNMKFSDLTNPYANYFEKDLYSFLNNHRLAYAPGTNYQYSNLGSGLLGHLLTLQAKSTYEDLVLNRIVVPLGMNSTRITLGDELRSRLAPGHDADGKQVSNWDNPVLAGAGSIRSTVNDLLLFAAANLVPPPDKLGEAIELAWTVHQQPIKKGNPTLGLGWHVMTDGTRWQNSQTGGYHSMFLVDRKTNLSVVLLTNTSTRDVEPLANDIFKMIRGEKVSARKLDKPIELPPESLRKLIGRYELQPGIDFTVEAMNDKLMIGLTGQRSHRVYPRSETVWYYKGIDATITFDVDKNGRCDSLDLFQNGIHQTARRAGNLSTGDKLTDNWMTAATIALGILAFPIYLMLTDWFEHRERMAMIENGLDPDSRYKLESDTE